MPSPESHADASPTFFRRFSGELTRLASDLDDFQNALSMLAVTQNDAETTIRIQALDELVQRAQALADVADHMTIEAPSSAVAVQRIVGAIGLRTLAESLSGEARAPESQEGEFELF
jgi:hypothetical protein